MSNWIKDKKKFRLSYMIPAGILLDIREKMISQGYDLKGKSKWISEAVNDLLVTENFSELVNINDQMQDFQKLDSISIDHGLKIQIDNAILEIRKNFPAMEGVQSKIIRTAIVQRLLR
jgi:hypothetical protein